MTEQSGKGALKLYIFVLSTMKPGKAASQVGHAVAAVVHESVSNLYENTTKDAAQANVDYLTWYQHPTKICYGVDAKQLEQLSNLDGAYVVIDHDGDQCVKPGTLVVVTFAPRLHAPSLASDDKWKLL
jgi:peptidyl-tRNA hydrolase